MKSIEIKITPIANITVTEIADSLSNSDQYIIIEVNTVDNYVLVRQEVPL